MHEKELKTKLVNVFRIDSS